MGDINKESVDENVDKKSVNIKKGGKKKLNNSTEKLRRRRRR